uniref:sphingosine N-acyltransferase n=1 Tax=Molossus molossus TaxID=27622 RepID=A0A7J8I4G2_MOLMO|nr:ceramide synthase 4 [Molossus molossus]
MWSSLNEWLWQDRFWLPPNNSWTELEDREGLVFAHPQDMLVALPLALALVAIRFTFERFVGLPLSRWLGVQDQARKLVKPNATLEKHFLMEGWRPNKPQIAVLATQCGLTLRQTQCWFRRRRNQDRPCLTKKFCEASWRFVFYLCSFFGGLLVLYHESWLWRPAMCWDNYPNQAQGEDRPGFSWGSDVLGESGSSFSGEGWLHPTPGNPLAPQAGSVVPTTTPPPHLRPRSLAPAQTCCALALWCCYCMTPQTTCWRWAQPTPLNGPPPPHSQACKMFNYAHQRRVCNSLFIIFSLVFFYTRLVLFPTQILYTTYYESIANSSPFFGYYFFNSLLVMLQLLHVFWACLVLRMIHSFTKKGQMEKDIRSDVEESASSEEEEAQKQPQLKNGAAQVPQESPTDGPRSRAAGWLANGHMLAT